MPVVGSGYAHGIDGLVSQQVAKILEGLRLMARLLGHGQRRFQVGLINVADGGDLNGGLAHSQSQVDPPHDAAADETDGDAVIGAVHISREDSGGKCCT
jgi:hypothetical protein